MVDEPFSFNAPQGGAVRGDNNQESHLILRYVPGKPSGPPYLIQNLFGKCFSLISHNYKYELCPYNNVTQREQAYRWNAFNGILGVWKEWLIDGDNFTSMHMVHGDPCAGNLERETKVNLTCGKKNSIVSVSEPSMCKYEIIFMTPYACPTDVFLIYPILSEGGQKKWQEIEKEHDMGVTTEKGYKKYKKKMLISEGQCAAEDLQKNTGAEQPDMNAQGSLHGHQQGPVTSSGVFAQDVSSLNARFSSKQQCDVEYTKLLDEVEMLREQIRNMHLIGIQSALSGQAETTVVKTMEIIESPVYDNSTKSSEKTNDEKHRKGDLGLHDKNITENAKPLKLRKLEGAKVANIISNKTNSISKVKKMLKKRRKGDDGILEEKNYPMRNLMGRLEYEANIISRLKVHGRLRDGQRKGGELKY